MPDKEEAPASGSLPPSIIREVVRAAYPELRHCYEEGLRGDPHLHGRLTVRFAIDREGNVAHSRFGESTLLDNNMGRCVLDIFSTLKFPQPKGGIVTVQYPILFSPAPDEEAPASDEDGPASDEDGSAPNSGAKSTSTREPESGASADPVSVPGAD